MLRYCLLFMALLAARPCAVCGEDRAPVAIGAVLPLSGGLAMRGRDIMNTVTLVVEEHNAADPAYRYTVYFEDGRCGVGNAANLAAHKLIELNRVKFILTGCSGDTLQAARVAQSKGVLAFAVLAMHQDVKTLGDFVFRTFVDVEQGLSPFIQELRAAGNGRVAIITEENAYTAGIRDVLLPGLGKDLVFDEQYAENDSDFKTLLTRVKAARPNALMLNAFSAQSLALLVKEVRRLGVEASLWSNLQAGDGAFRKAAGADAVGIRFFDTPDGADNAAFNHFLQRYVKKFGAPSYEFGVRTTYDALQALLAGVQTVGPDAQAVRDFLNDYSADGALGRIEFDANGDLKQLRYVLRELR